ncbi:hypothetical protein M0802_015289 [Mischocyttarus mexicanus]|nr:hypothetical protein M0802_015288 [Mischocyttarus mexicanus]KAI4475093.1 hypothetical protein M0802_015289 [Mischocyttarus mexicanus]
MLEQSDRKGGQGSKNLLVQFSQVNLKNKTRLIQDKSTTVRVFFSNHMKKLRQGFLCKKFRQSQNKVIGIAAKVRRSF